MATNSFFSNYDHINTQNLIDDLVIESIQIFGIDTWYITRALTSEDKILNEDRLTVFDGAHQIDVYVKSVDGFQGDGDFLSKFGLQIRDQATFTVAIRTFERYVIQNNKTYTRPKEGDLIYLPMNKKFFEITFVEHESVFYQTGALQVYDLKCELFEYSNERFQTGISVIDAAYADYDTSNITTITDLQDMDLIAKNIFYEDEANTFIDFSEIDPFSEIITFPGT
jgi:hypothetical protein